MNKTSYFLELIKQGKDTPEKICSQIKSDIEKLDAQISERNALVNKRKHLILLLSDLGDTTFQNGQKNFGGNNIFTEENSPELKPYQDKIIQYIKENGPSTNLEIQEAIGSWSDKRNIIFALKVLAENGIISRDNSVENKVIKGKNWDSNA